MPEHREAQLYEHYQDRLIEAADPVGAYLFAQIERQFQQQFTRCPVLPDAASERPALASAPTESPAGVGPDSQTHEPMEQA